MPAAAYPQKPPTTPSTNKLKTNPARVSRVGGIVATPEWTPSPVNRQAPVDRWAERRPADCGLVRAQSLANRRHGFLHDDEAFASGCGAHPRTSRGLEPHVEALPVRFKGLRAFAESLGSRRYAFHGVREGIDAAR